MPSPRTNWHEAITCAIQIDLRDYSHLLEYKTEHFLSHNRNRIDLLVIRKRPDIPIPKHIASLFMDYTDLSCLSLSPKIISAFNERM